MSVLIELNSQRGLYVSCPNCSEEFPIAKARLFDATQKALPIEAIDYLQQKREELKKARAELAAKKKATDRSRITAQAVNIGKVVEKIAPSLPGFPVLASDCRSLFEPIDYVVFNGLTKAHRVDSLTFVDVKSGKARLSHMQSQVKNLVECGKVTLTVVEPSRIK